MSELRERLERETELGAHVGDGWWPFIEAAALLLDAAYPGWKSGQIKEKFAGLRFYITPAPFRDQRPEEVVDAYYTRAAETDEQYAEASRRWYDEQEAIATAAERACDGVCEICGEPAKVVGKGWIHMLCANHAAQYVDEGTMRGML